MGLKILTNSLNNTVDDLTEFSYTELGNFYEVFGVHFKKLRKQLIVPFLAVCFSRRETTKIAKNLGKSFAWQKLCVIFVKSKKITAEVMFALCMSKSLQSGKFLPNP